MVSFPIFIYFTPKREDCRAQHESFSNVLFLCISPRCMDAFLQYSKWASQFYISCCVNLKIWKLLEKCCEASRTIKTDDICLYHLRRYLLFLIYCIMMYMYGSISWPATAAPTIAPAIADPIPNPWPWKCSEFIKIKCIFSFV